MHSPFPKSYDSPFPGPLYNSENMRCPNQSSKRLISTAFRVVFGSDVPKPIADLTYQVTFDSLIYVDSGSFAPVYAADCRPREPKRRRKVIKPVAVKYFPLPDVWPCRRAEEMKAEVALEAQLHCELSCERGDRHSQNGSVQMMYYGQLLPFQTILCMLHDVANAMLFFHMKGYVHRDLAWRNVLVCRESGKEKYLVCDFGLTAPEGGPARKRGIIERSIYPPGISSGDVPTKSDDVYSFGIMIQEAMNGFGNFHANKQWEESFKDLMKMCTSVSVSEQPSSNEIVARLQNLINSTPAIPKHLELGTNRNRWLSIIIAIIAGIAFYGTVMLLPIKVS
ncbi:hypothetical protein Pelo_1680 [Pelomyxa schiedti]|nr:hypothetical protein Pelo_1680 [Pelomyxa schiedti]